MSLSSLLKMSRATGGTSTARRLDANWNSPADAECLNGSISVCRHERTCPERPWLQRRNSWP